MIFVPTRLPGVFEVQLDRKLDERGFFARTWCQKEFADHGLSPRLAQCSISFNPVRGTLRGMHYQEAPHQEAKLVRCTRGAIWDVALDLRSDSPAFGKWVGATLSAENRGAVYIPEGCAHGFISLEENSEVFYQISEFYNGQPSRGVRWNDPAFGIDWPVEVRQISERDRTYPDYQYSNGFAETV
jgi:dTDP-4-dehydrorhamnose 3,5-epimerase